MDDNFNDCRIAKNYNENTTWGEGWTKQEASETEFGLPVATCGEAGCACSI